MSVSKIIELNQNRSVHYDYVLDPNEYKDENEDNNDIEYRIICHYKGIDSKFILYESKNRSRCIEFIKNSNIDYSINSLYIEERKWKIST